MQNVVKVLIDNQLNGDMRKATLITDHLSVEYVLKDFYNQSVWNIMREDIQMKDLLNAQFALRNSKQNLV